MGITDTITGTAREIALNLVGRAAAKLASTITNYLFGDVADDGIAAKVARDMVNAGVQRAAVEAGNRIAAPLLDKRMRDLAEMIERDFANIFEPKGDIPAIGVVTYTCELSGPSWDLFRSRVDLAKIAEPTDSQRANLGAVGVFDGTIICLSDADRRVPLAIAKVLAA